MIMAIKGEDQLKQMVKSYVNYMLLLTKIVCLDMLAKEHALFIPCSQTSRISDSMLMIIFDFSA